MTDLHFIRLTLHLDELGRWAAGRDRGWAGRGVRQTFDEGRALHHLLAETFGQGVLQPFRLFPMAGGERGSLYAYATADAAALTETARACAMPEIEAVVDLDRIQGKPMPGHWTAGRRFGFDVRVRPVRRISRPLPRADGDAFAPGAELDAFLVEALRRFPEGARDEAMLRAGRSREAVYADWLAEQIGAAAQLEAGTRLAGFERRRLARTGRAPEGPDAILHGTLVITDPEAFTALLARGLGRHRAYGYGMLLLRPPGRDG
ncbi:type I-E CRISPR-associated protein Cas6/Cse3/CasE (plasmid) [Tistrella mobilis]|uniref:Type I-E CRISPR-associated protein Cas6/Cse3/CasE n=1 Tax=Tistrella mobilis TaxID=171437 RepID=A0A162KLK9_9PROT|nr:type I-E CRISPR-associated protein Cas6/Cse3/CasE [Tistrella mobilis]KYO51562.1 hypothetical protein AUP44_08565 [Tistrella mobilis]